MMKGDHEISLVLERMSNPLDTKNYMDQYHTSDL